jgi:hypothetical protein
MCRQMQTVGDFLEREPVRNQFANGNPALKHQGGGFGLIVYRRTITSEDFFFFHPYRGRRETQLQNGVVMSKQ